MVKKKSIGLIIILIVAAVIVFFLVNKSDNKDPSLSTSAPASSQQSINSSKTISTKTDTSGSKYLVNASGKPLYTYGNDTTGVSNCTNACLVHWPIYGPASSSASLPASITIINRSDNKAQYAYKGMPLYTFTGDANMTMPMGGGVSNFQLAKP